MYSMYTIINVHKTANNLKARPTILNVELLKITI